MSTGLLSGPWEAGLLPNRHDFFQLQLLPRLGQALEPSHPGLGFPKLSHWLPPQFSVVLFCFFLPKNYVEHYLLNMSQSV